MTDLYEESEEFCNYALALSVFSLMREPSSQSSRTVTSMVTDLKSRIITSKDCEFEFRLFLLSPSRIVALSYFWQAVGGRSAKTIK